jgi:hypothetical protein
MSRLRTHNLTILTGNYQTNRFATETVITVKHFKYATLVQHLLYAIEGVVPK